MQRKLGPTTRSVQSFVLKKKVSLWASERRTRPWVRRSVPRGSVDWYLGEAVLAALFLGKNKWASPWLASRKPRGGRREKQCPHYCLSVSGGIKSRGPFRLLSPSHNHLPSASPSSNSVEAKRPSTKRNQYHVQSQRRYQGALCILSLSARSWN